VYLVAAACAVVVYLGALRNGFALDDGAIIVFNPLVQQPSGLWRAFARPYWAAGQHSLVYYRPLPVATYVLDHLVHKAWWFHLVNLGWHAGASIAVAALAQRWRGVAAGLVAGLVFAVHPVHVEAVANVIGRAELMATLFALLAVYAGLVRQSVGWSSAALALAVLSKENAAVVPALIVWAWVVGVGRPSRGRMAAFAAAWMIGGAAYALLRLAVLHRLTGPLDDLAPVFVGADPLSVRLTALAGLADVGRLLVFPRRLRVEYTPAERTLVTSPLDGRFLLGLACLAMWTTLLVLAWRRARKTEALGLGWMGIAYLPVANLLFPSGILLAERTLYLPSAGLALAAGAWLHGLSGKRLGAVCVALTVAEGARTALRVPVWRDDASVALSILQDSPNSYRGPQYAAGLLQAARSPAKALRYYTIAAGVYDHDARSEFGAADAAFALGRPQLADTLLAQAKRLCGQCETFYLTQVSAARTRGDSAVADSLLARFGRLKATSP